MISERDSFGQFTFSEVNLRNRAVYVDGFQGLYFFPQVQEMFPPEIMGQFHSSVFGWNADFFRESRNSRRFAWGEGMSSLEKGSRKSDESFENFKNLSVC